jgi:hypothetical protein
MACCADKTSVGEAMTDIKPCADDCKKACCADKKKTLQ